MTTPMSCTHPSVICTLDAEVNGEWQHLKRFDNFDQASNLARTLSNAGIPAMVSCACGAYAYGECGQCAPELAEVNAHFKGIARR